MGCFSIPCGSELHRPSTKQAKKSKSIWVLNPFKNWGAVFTGFGIVTTLVIILIICLITKKGYIWFSGYKYTHDPRGFDILPGRYAWHVRFPDGERNA